MKRNIIPDVISGDQALCSVPSSASAKAAADLMAERHIGAVLVIDHGELAGIVTERDIVTRLVALGRNPDDVAVSSIMTAQPTTVAPDDTAAHALETMRLGRYRHLPVIRDSEICGIVSIRDLFEAVKDNLEEQLHDVESFIQGEHYGSVA